MTPITQNFTIRPGLLVGLKTRIKGGVKYETTDESVDRDGREETKTWRTLRHVDDVGELERATETRSKASTLIRSVCIATPFGLLCPTDRREELENAVASAERMAAEHNADAVHTRIDVFVIRGEIAENDRQATRAILSEVRDALDEMRKGIETVNVQAIREAATRARTIGQMLTDGQGERVSRAVSAARAAAREIVKRVEKGGELAAVVLRDISTTPIDDMRFSFLDTDDDTPLAAIGDAEDALPVMAELDLTA